MRTLYKLLLTPLLLIGCTQSYGKTLESEVYRYFDSWSAQDMKTYKELFHPLAVINMVDKLGVIDSKPLNSFVEIQRLAHKNSLVKMKEYPVDIKTYVLGNIAQASVKWEMVIGNNIRTGANYFTYVRHDSKWKIINLTWEQF